MASPRPRFGGGTTMENQTTGTSFAMSEMSGEEPVCIDTSIVMDVRSDARVTGCGLGVVANTSDARGDIVEDGHVGSCRSNDDLQDRERIGSSESESQLADQKLSNKLALPTGDKLNEMPVKADKQQEGETEELIRVLNSLGIHVEVKQYIPPDSRNTGRTSGRDWAREGEAIYAQHSKSINMCTSVYMEDSVNTINHHLEEGNRPSIQVLYCKNLFLKDRKGRYYLVIADESASVDLKVLKQQLNATRNLSFADEKAALEILGSKPGEISPFVAMRKSAGEVRFVLHPSLFSKRAAETRLAFHPLDGSLQIDVTVDQLDSFLQHCGKELEVIPPDNNMTEIGRRPAKKSLATDDRDDGSNVTLSGDSSISNTVPPETVISNIETMVKVKLSEEDEKADDVVFDRQPLAASCNSSEIHSQKDIAQSVPKTSMLMPIVNGKPMWKVYQRKGKLKSLLKKADHHTVADSGDDKTHSSSLPSEEISGNENEQSAQTGTPNQIIQDADTNQQSPTIQTKMDGKKINNENENKASQQLNTSAKVSRPPTMLSEITDFNDSLSRLCVPYEDLDLRVSTTRDIGPSLGCKCIVLKDRKQNVFLVITHEYYELDYGRLKKALKPRKKLDLAEASDILEVMGAEPFRVTPFSCTSERARANNVQVFMTEKIRPMEVVLCIQHPYAEGRRLVMTSESLQKYLLEFLPQIGNVEEKLWPDRFNRIFTRFTDPIDKVLLASKFGTDSHLSTPNHEPESNDSVTDGIEGPENQKATDDATLMTSIPLSSVVASTLTSTVNVFRNITQACLAYYSNSNFTILRTGNCHAKRESSESDGSSVDLPFEHKTSDGNHDDNHIPFGEITQSIKAEIGKSYNDAEGKDHFECFGAGRAVKPKSALVDTIEMGFEIDSEDGERASYPYEESRRNTNLLNTVEHIVHDLKELDVEFEFTRRPAKAMPTQVESQCPKTDVPEECKDPQYSIMYNNKDVNNGTSHGRQITNVDEQKASQSSKSPPIERLAQNNITPTLSTNDGLREDHEDNVEICVTSYLRDGEQNHYVIVGGETDYITIKRFRRRFCLVGNLRVCEVNSPGLTTTPFSIAHFASKEKERGGNTKIPGREDPKVYVVLFSSLYVDPDTICDFHVDQYGSVIRMTSLELENYVKKAGLELWYMP